MSMCTLGIFSWPTSTTLVHGPNIPGSYAILLCTASELTCITSPIQNWLLFLLWLHPIILSGVISPIISSSILGTYRPGEFFFQCPIIMTPLTAGRQASLSITNSRSFLKLMSIESVMPSSHLILCRPLSFRLQSFPASGSFPMSPFLASGGQSIPL